jgi:general secretion pathway protein M
MKTWHALMGRWNRLQARERLALSIMVAVLVCLAAWQLLWQSSRDHLAQAQEGYRDQLALATQAARAQAWQAGSAPAQTLLPSHLNDSALAAGLQVKQFEIDSDTQRMTLLGDTSALLGWLHLMQQQGLRIESLVLEVEGATLQLVLVAAL